MISLIAAALTLLVQVLKICWEARQEAQARVNDPEEEVIATNVAATRGDEGEVQAHFAEWSRRGDLRNPRAIDRGLRPHEEEGRNRDRSGAAPSPDQKG